MRKNNNKEAKQPKYGTWENNPTKEIKPENTKGKVMVKVGNNPTTWKLVSEERAKQLLADYEIEEAMKREERRQIIERYENRN